MSQSRMLVGVAKRVITPVLGSRLSGFDARKDVATAVHDDLYARTFVIAYGDEAVAIVSLDLLGMTQDLTDAVRRAVNRSTGIAERNVILCATHTHCGPVTIPHFYDASEPLDYEYRVLLERNIIASIEEAYAAMEPSTLRSGLIKVEGIAVNRRTENGLPIDDYAGVLLVESLAGTSKAIIVNYACHPTVLGPNTLDVTRDFPHYLDLTLTQEYGDDVTVLYFNGTQGDLSIGHKSFLSAIGVVAAFRTYEKAQQVGEKLAKAVIAGLPQLKEEADDLYCQHTVASLPLKSYLPYADMKQRTAEAKAISYAADAGIGPGTDIPQEVLQKRQDYLFARIEEYYSSMRDKAPSETQLHAEVSVIRIGATAMLFVPGEVFVEIGLAIRARSPFANTMLFGLANDYIGYVPTIEQSKLKGYEVIGARVTPEASLVLEDYAMKALQAAFSATPQEK